MKRALAFIICLCMALSCACISETAVPERVAVLFSSYAEMWLEAGGSIYATVGESVTRGFVSEDTLLVDDGAGKAINMELLLSYQPDLVICSADIAAQAEAAEVLMQAGIPCLCLTVENFDDYAEAFALMTELTGSADAYETYVTSAKAQIEETVSANACSGTYVFIRSGNSSASTKIKQSEEHFACGVINAFGLSNIADSGTAASGAVNIEALLAADPEWIFFSLMGDEEAACAYVMQLLSQPEWQCLTAVREGRTVILPKSLFHFKPNSRWPQTYRFVADMLSE